MQLDNSIESLLLHNFKFLTWEINTGSPIIWEESEASERMQVSNGPPPNFSEDFEDERVSGKVVLDLSVIN